MIDIVTFWFLRSASRDERGVCQRKQWLAELPVKHLAYAHHAEEMTRQNFEDQLTPATDVMPQVQISGQEVLARLTEINDRFDVRRPLRLKVRVMSYSRNLLSIAVSDAGQPAQRKLIELNTKSLSHEEMLDAAKDRIGKTIQGFLQRRRRSLVREHAWQGPPRAHKFVLGKGLNVVVWVPIKVVNSTL